MYFSLLSCHCIIVGVIERVYSCAYIVIHWFQYGNYLVLVTESTIYLNNAHTECVHNFFCIYGS